MSRVIPQGDSALPPPGDERREVLRERADNLAQAAEVTGTERERISPKAFHVDNEIASKVVDDDLAVSNAQVEYVYCWVFSGRFGIMVRQKLADQWEVVQGDDPEALEHKGIGADTTRRIGDVLLMRCRRERFKMIEKREQRKRDAQAGAVMAPLEDLSARYAPQGVSVRSFDVANPRLQQRIMNQAAARQFAGREFDRMIREGTVPGAPVPGQE